MTEEKIREERIFEIVHCPFEDRATEWASRPVLVRWQLKRAMYDFKNSFSPAFVYIHRAKYIFSRDMFCLPHFWAKIHSVDWLCHFSFHCSFSLFKRSFSIRDTIVLPLLQPIIFHLRYFMTNNYTKIMMMWLIEGIRARIFDLTFEIVLFLKQIISIDQK